MSWKGIQKSVVRAPQSLRQKLNIGEQTKDAVFNDAERRFKELEVETKKLHDESEKYFAAINSMLTHQIEFSKGIEEIYNPISGRASDPNAAIPEGNPEGIKACEMYREIVSDLQTTLQPELEMLDTRIVKPAEEMLEIVKNVRKLVVKRAHKQLDLDRHTNSLKKLQEKKEKTLKDEKAIYKVENDVEVATQEYDYYNDLLKDDLPKLFQLETEFIKPLFQSFYYMQLNIFYTLYERMNQANIPYFNLSADDDIEKAFEAKRGNIQERAEQIPITHFNLQRARKKLPDPKFRKPGAPGAIGATGSPYSPDGSAAPPPYTTSGSPQPGYDEYQTAEYSGYSPTAAYSTAAYNPSAGYGSPGTAYGPQAGYQQPAAAGYNQAGALPDYQQPTDPQYAGYPVEKKAAPLPPSKPSGLSSTPGVEYCIAQFDYAAQAEGDLSFNAGDRIEIVQRTADPNGWWTGILNGYQGVFPGNYVALED
ncbi:BAR domain-containing protein [Lipomyces kononenkoae]|uniref:BAR domain-containing protein n=1 Tax=Lipomyces kononenkoae TaxID=34357 RepID=A0ACC3T7A9_LIPKO